MAEKKHEQQRHGDETKPHQHPPAVGLFDVLLHRGLVKADPQLADQLIVRTKHRHDDVINLVAALAEEKIFAEIVVGGSVNAFEFCQRHLPGQQLIVNDALYSGGLRVLADQICQQVGLRARIIDELGLIIVLQDEQHTDKNQRHQNGVNGQHPKQHAPGVAGKKTLGPSQCAHGLPMIRIPGVLIAVSYSMKVMVALSFCNAASRSVRFS